MSAVNESITSSSSPSSEFTPSQQISDVDIGPGGEGKVMLEYKIPSGGWKTLTNQAGAFSIMTPDNGIIYRFSSTSDNSVNVYIGP